MASEVADRNKGIDASVWSALQDFAQALSRYYGSRFRKLVVFGSRARQQAQPDSDIDVAVVIDALEGRRYDERMRMADIAYDILLSTGMDIQAWPVAVSEWEERQEHSNPDLLGNMKREGIEFRTPLRFPRGIS